MHRLVSATVVSCLFCAFLLKFSCWDDHAYLPPTSLYSAGPSDQDYLIVCLLFCLAYRSTIMAMSRPQGGTLKFSGYIGEADFGGRGWGQKF